MSDEQFKNLSYLTILSMLMCLLKSLIRHLSITFAP